MGSVHDGSFGNACKLIEAAAAAGADAVKFQTHIPEAETTRDAPMPSYFRGEPRFDYFRRTGFTLSQWRELKAACDAAGVEFLSSPFSNEAVELLEEVGVRRFKVGSGEVTNLPMLRLIGRTGKPVLLSSGMSTWAELDQAVEAASCGGGQVTILQCTSKYPCPYEDVGLDVMVEAGKRYGLPYGYSDHTLTPFACFAAVVLGAVVVEKHFTFSRLMYGSDARHSAEPDELRTLVEGIRAIEVMLGSTSDKDRTAGDLGEMKRIFEKSVVSVLEIPAGTRIERSMIGIKKPGTGIPARHFEAVIGKTAARNIPADRPLTPEDLA